MRYFKIALFVSVLSTFAFAEWSSTDSQNLQTIEQKVWGIDEDTNSISLDSQNIYQLLNRYIQPNLGYIWSFINFELRNALQDNTSNLALLSNLTYDSHDLLKSLSNETYFVRNEIAHNTNLLSRVVSMLYLTTNDISTIAHNVGASSNDIARIASIVGVYSNDLSRVANGVGIYSNDFSRVANGVGNITNELRNLLLGLGVITNQIFDMSRNYGYTNAVNRMTNQLDSLLSWYGAVPALTNRNARNFWDGFFGDAGSGQLGPWIIKSLTASGETQNNTYSAITSSNQALRLLQLVRRYLSSYAPSLVNNTYWAGENARKSYLKVDNIDRNVANYAEKSLLHEAAVEDWMYFVQDWLENYHATNDVYVSVTNDLSGIIITNDLSGLVVTNNIDLSGLVVTNDLSGIVITNDLSGIVITNDLSGLVVTNDIDLSGLTVTNLLDTSYMAWTNDAVYSLHDIAVVSSNQYDSSTNYYDKILTWADALTNDLYAVISNLSMSAGLMPTNLLESITNSLATIIETTNFTWEVNSTNALFRYRRNMSLSPLNYNDDDYWMQDGAYYQGTNLFGNAKTRGFDVFTYAVVTSPPNQSTWQQIERLPSLFMKSTGDFYTDNMRMLFYNTRLLGNVNKILMLSTNVLWAVSTNKVSESDIRMEGEGIVNQKEETEKILSADVFAPLWNDDNYTVFTTAPEINSAWFGGVQLPKTLSITLPKYTYGNAQSRAVGGDQGYTITLELEEYASFFALVRTFFVFAWWGLFAWMVWVFPVRWLMLFLRWVWSILKSLYIGA